MNDYPRLLLRASGACFASASRVSVRLSAVAAIAVAMALPLGCITDERTSEAQDTVAPATDTVGPAADTAAPDGADAAPDSASRCGDDGDPCDGCQGTCSAGQCDRTAPIGCGGPVGCDDFDPCTADRCTGACVCAFDVIADCSGCRRESATDIADLPDTASEETYWVEGTAGFAGSGACVGTETECLACGAPLALIDIDPTAPGAERDEVLVTTSDPLTSPWACRWRSGAGDCSTSPQCEPFADGDPYLAWGKLTHVDVGVDGPRPLGMAVDGWCMQPTRRGITGDYTAIIALSDPNPGGGPLNLKFKLGLDVAAGSTGVDVGSEPLACVGCITLAEVALEDASFTSGRLVLRYALTLEGGQVARLIMLLRPLRDTLVGPAHVISYQTGDGELIDGSVDAPLASGEAVFER